MTQSIAFVMRLFQADAFYGGGEKLFYRLIQECIRHQWDVDVYCAQTDVSELPGIRIISLDIPYHMRDYEQMGAFYMAIRGQLSTARYDAVLSENITPPLDMTFVHGHTARFRQRYVRSQLSRFLYAIRPKKRRQLIYEQRWMNQGYRAVIVPSNRLKQDLLESYRVQEESIYVVYPGVDVLEPPSVFGKLITEPLVVFGLSAPGFVRKGGYTFLKALYLLKKRGVPFRARIIYPGYKQNLGVRLTVWRYGLQSHVEFLGFQHDFSAFLNSIDCLVMPSVEETFGMAALEAMAYGKPCIISSRAGAAELIDHGKNGLIVSWDKTPDRHLAEQLGGLVHHPEQLADLGRHAYETACQYPWERAFGTLAGIITQANTVRPFSPVP